MVKYDTSRTVRFAMDRGTGHDSTIHNNIINTLRNAGFTVTDGGIGPNTIAQQYSHIPSKGNHIIFSLMNGVDTRNIREAISKGDGAWTKSSMKGKNIVVVLGWCADSVDCVHEDGKGYQHLCTHSSGVGGCGGPMYNAKQQMDAGGNAGNKVYALCCSSDGGAKPSQKDNTGFKIAEEFLKFFEISDGTNTNTNTNTNANTTTTDDTGKTISSITTEKIYTKPYYQTVTTANTNNIGAFTKAMQLPTAGKYRVNLTFSGDKDYTASQKTINIEYYAGEIFKEQLLETITTKNYTDGTTSTVKEGDVGKNTHTRSVITTQTYKNKQLDKTTTTEKNNDRTNNDFKKDNTTTDNNTTNNNNTTIPSDTQNPFETYIPCVKDTDSGEYKPNVEKMHYNNTPFKWADTSKAFVLTKEQYQEVFNNDSKIMQTQNYHMSRYVAFRTEDEPNTYHVMKREVWNAIEEAIYYRQVKVASIGNKNKYKPSLTDFPTKIKINIPNLEIQGWVNNAWGTTYSMKSKECYYWFCGDNQDTGYTCGPTSCSQVSQVVHKYVSEEKLQRMIGATDGSGSAPSAHVKAMNQLGFSATLWSKKYSWDKFINHLKEGKIATFHVYNHYIGAGLITKDEEHIMVLNSTISSSYGPLTGWRETSKVKSSSLYENYGLLIDLNWSINESEKKKLENYYKSMGGAYEVIYNTTEKIRELDV